MALSLKCASFGVASGILKVSDILSISDGAPAGFLTSGISGMMATVVLVLSVYGIMGVLTAAGVMDRIADGILRSRLGKTVRGAEIAMMLGISVTTLIFGGVISASMATFGKIQNEIGKRVGLHPYRRANLLDGFANAIVLVMPFLSVFVFIGTSLTEGYDMAEPLTVTQVGGSMFYSMMLSGSVIFSSHRLGKTIRGGEWRAIESKIKGGYYVLFYDLPVAGRDTYPCQ